MKKFYILDFSELNGFSRNLLVYGIAIKLIERGFIDSRKIIMKNFENNKFCYFFIKISDYFYNFFFSNRFGVGLCLC